MGIQLHGIGNNYGERVREQIEPPTQRTLEMEILALKNQKSSIKTQMAETRARRAELGDDTTEQTLKELRQQLMDVIAQLEKKNAQLQKIYEEQLQPKTKAREAVERPVEERYDTVEISANDTIVEDLEEFEESDAAAGMRASDEAELLRLAQELEDEETGGGKVFG